MSVSTKAFSPLGNWLQPSAAAWDGFARMSHSRNGVIAVVRNQSNASTANVQLPLMPAGEFKVPSMITNKDLGAFAKDDWIRGVQVSFAESQSVEILEVTSLK